MRILRNTKLPGMRPERAATVAASGRADLARGRRPDRVQTREHPERGQGLAGRGTAEARNASRGKERGWARLAGPRRARKGSMRAGLRARAGAEAELDKAKASSQTGPAH